MTPSGRARRVQQRRQLQRQPRTRAPARVARATARAGARRDITSRAQSRYARTRAHLGHQLMRAGGGASDTAARAARQRAEPELVVLTVSPSHRKTHRNVAPTVYVVGFALFAVTRIRHVSGRKSFAETFAVTVDPGNTE